MIATVKIAPVERWCEYPKTQPSYVATAGMLVQIHTEDMRMSRNPEGELYREWPMTDGCSEKFSEITGVSYDPDDERLFVCEHMLEMD